MQHIDSLSRGGQWALHTYLVKLKELVVHIELVEQAFHLHSPHLL